MGLLDVLLGRSRPVPPDLDVLFRIPGAALTLKDATGFATTGAGTVCFKAAEGATSRSARVDIRALLALDPGTTVAFDTDRYGFTWVTCQRADRDLTTLTTQLHGVNRTLDDAGLGSTLLCTVSGFASNPVDGPERRLGLVYLFKRGTFYPFAPTGRDRRDTDLELQVGAVLDGELPIEPDRRRWFPVWDAPVP